MSNGIDFKKIALENRDLLNAALAREDVLREDLESIKASVDGYDSPEHAAQVADELGHQCSALQQRLTVAEQLLREAQAEFNYNPEGSCYNPGISFVKPWSIKVIAALKPAVGDHHD